MRFQFFLSSPRYTYFFSIFLGILFLISSGVNAQSCVFETAADLYTLDADEPQKVYRPVIDGADVKYESSGSIDADVEKIKAKKVLLIHDQNNGMLQIFDSQEPRCSFGSELFARPENEEIIVFTKQGELIKGYGNIFPYSENLKIYKDEHRSGSYYGNISSTTEIVFLIHYMYEIPDTKFFVGGKDLGKYNTMLYNLLVPAKVVETKEEPAIIPEAIVEAVIEEEVVEEIEVAIVPAETELNEGSNSSGEPGGPVIKLEDVSTGVGAVAVPVAAVVTESEVKAETQVKAEEIITEPIALNPTETTTAEEPLIGDNLLGDDELIIPTVTRSKPKPVMNDLEKEELMIKAKEKVETLGGCFQILASPSSANAFKDDNFKLAVSLFIHDSVEVTVSSLARDNFKFYRITTYLKRMRTFSYTDVEISFHNVSKVSNLRRNPDGTYTGIITFSQVFKGFIEGKPVYGDRTDKNIEIIIRAREVFAGTMEASIEWDVFLGNIGVDQTSAF